jgi:hypothetical protein
LLALALYLWILPTIWSSSYTKSVKPLYLQQANQITTVYRSIASPVFSGNNSSAASDAQDLQYIAGIIEIATNNTNALKSKNHLIVLPGSTWLHSVYNADIEYKTMQQYISNSLAFLQNYQSLIIYTQEIQQFAKIQIPKFINDTNAINESMNSKPTYATDLQRATTDLQSFINQVKGLRLPADLQSFNQTLLTDLNEIDSSLSAQESDIKNNNVANFNSQQAIYVSVDKNFTTLLNANPTADIQTNSTIHSQIITLQSEHPLQ